MVTLPRVALAMVLVVVACERGTRKKSTASPDGSTPRSPRITCPQGTAARDESTTATWCERPDGRRHGPYLERYPDGSERTRGQHVDGMRDGEWIGSWTDGKRRSVEHYDRGKPSGMWITFFPDGTHSSENEHRDDGRVVHRTFRPDGSKTREGVFVDGVEDGEWTEWDANGTATKRTYARAGKPTSDVPAVIGIVECDRYIANMRRCVADKLPEAVRAQVTQALDTTVEGWMGMASGPAKDQLASACKTAYDAAAAGMVALGCEW